MHIYRMLSKNLEKLTIQSIYPWAAHVSFEAPKME